MTKISSPRLSELISEYRDWHKKYAKGREDTNVSLTITGLSFAFYIFCLLTNYFFGWFPYANHAFGPLFFFCGIGIMVYRYSVIEAIRELNRLKNELDEYGYCIARFRKEPGDHIYIKKEGNLSDTHFIKIPINEKIDYRFYDVAFKIKRGH